MNKRLEQARKTLGLNQSQFGSNIGVKQGAVSIWEKGLRPIPDGRLALIEKIYGVSSDWIKNGEGSMFVKDAEATSSVEETTSPETIDLTDEDAFVQAALRLLEPITKEKLDALNLLLSKMNFGDDSATA